MCVGEWMGGCVGEFGRTQDYEWTQGYELMVATWVGRFWVSDVYYQNYVCRPT